MFLSVLGSLVCGGEKSHCQSQSQISNVKSKCDDSSGLFAYVGGNFNQNLIKLYSHGPEKNETFCYEGNWCAVVSVQSGKNANI